MKTTAPTKTENPPPAGVTAVMIPLAKIFPSPTQPRTHFPAAEQAEMEASMRSIGFTISTLLVRPEQNTYFIDNTQPEAADGGQFWVMRQTGLGPLQGVIETVEMCPSREAAEKLLAKLSGRFELVAGERRFRAAKTVGIEEAPCIVQTLTDREVLEIQLIENAQRKDLTVMEEAVGYGRLLDLRDEKGGAVYTAKTLSVKIGKDLRTVERLRKLRVLAEDQALKPFREALENGVVTTGHAILVARMPDAKLRAELAKQILAPKFDEAPLSIRKAELLTQKEFMVDLRTAGFDQADAELLPVETDDSLFKNRLRGGACTDCPFKAGNSAGLFDGELPSGMHNMCLNPECFDEKGKIGWQRWQERETDPAKNRRALSEEECKKLYRFGDQLEWNAPYVDLAEKPDSFDLKAGEEAPGTWRGMLKGVAIEVVVVRDRNGRKHELVSRDLAKAAVEKAAKDNGETTIFKAESKASAGGGSASYTSRAETPEEKAARFLKVERELELAMAGEKAVARAIAEKSMTGKALPKGFWAELLAIWMEDNYSGAPGCLEKRRGWKEASLVAQTAKLEEHHQVSVMVECAYWHAIETNGEKPLLKLFGIDAKPLEKAAETALKAEFQLRDAALAEIEKLAGVATLKPKNLDAIAEVLCKKKFAAVKASHELMAIRDEIVKRGQKSTAEGAKKAEGAEKKPAKKKEKAATLTPEARGKLVSPMTARWAQRAKK